MWTYNGDGHQYFAISSVKNYGGTDLCTINYLSRITIKAEQQTEDWKNIFCNGAGVLSGLKYMIVFFPLPYPYR